MRPTGLAIWAHRGSHGGRRLENTLPAFEQALREGADGIELDVRASADGVSLVVHDLTLSRLGGDAVPVDARSAAATCAVRLAGGATVPRLGEVLALVAGQVPVNVELKSVAAAWPAARALRPIDDVIVSSFLPEALAAFAAVAPWVPRALLTERTAPAAPPWGALRALGCVAWHAWFPTLTASEVRAATARGYAVRAYTVRHVGHARALAAMGVAGAFVDQPGAMKRRLG